ncbi:MAG: RNA 2',3'-cyclic phosphodiesterase [Dehalococcoidales bacterium]|nr:RNA 2',3'-cyclic phosphodiesterase [Dehalococcoidales bacterium]
MEKIRSFIAIELPQDLKSELGKLQARLKVAKPRIKWVSPDGIHLTLKFLGDIETTAVDRITQAMTEAVNGIQPFDLCIGQMGVFPNYERVQVVWVGLDGQLDTLDRLYHRLEDSMAKAGFPPEKRGFKPHLTLARVADEAMPDERKRFGDLIAAGKAEINHSFKASGLSLMKSTLTPRGAVYNRLAYVSFSYHNDLR